MGILKIPTLQRHHPHHEISVEQPWGDAQALEQLRALPAADVVKGMGFINPLYSGPMIDGTIVPYNMMTAYDSGKFAHVPLLIGTNTGDMNLNRAKTKDELFAAFGDQSARARSVYDPSGQADFKAVQAEFGADNMMHETARFTARQFSAAGVPTYLYRFGYVAAVNMPQAPGNAAALRDTFTYGGVGGALHTTEIPFVFDTVAGRYGAATTSEDRAMARWMSAYWVAFAKTGSPNGARRPTWAPYTATSDRLFLFEKDASGMAKDPWKDRLDVTQTLNEKIRE